MSNPFLDPHSPHYRPPAQVELFPGQFVPRTLGGAARVLKQCCGIRKLASLPPDVRKATRAEVGEQQLKIERLLFISLVYAFKFSTDEWRVIADKAGWSASELNDLLLADWLSEEPAAEGEVKIDEGVICPWEFIN